MKIVAVVLTGLALVTNAVTGVVMTTQEMDEMIKSAQEDGKRLAEGNLAAAKYVTEAEFLQFKAEIQAQLDRIREFDTHIASNSFSHASFVKWSAEPVMR